MILFPINKASEILFVADRSNGKRTSIPSINIPPKYFPIP